MSKSTSRPTPDIQRARFDAVLFDLDGVLTDTARLHAACWKQVFDELLEARAGETGGVFVPFDAEDDYRRFVDGKARLDGVRDFLGARGIVLPEGTARSSPQERSVQGLGRRKDERFSQLLTARGVHSYPGSVCWLRRLRASGFACAVVSASHHCAEVLAAADLAGLFDVRVDGQLADRLGLAGKPAPDTFVEAARLLGVAPARAVVVEDAVAGVRAGRAGGFAMVIGVARSGGDAALRAAGADVVVTDLGELLA